MHDFSFLALNSWPLKTAYLSKLSKVLVISCTRTPSTITKHETMISSLEIWSWRLVIWMTPENVGSEFCYVMTFSWSMILFMLT